MKLLDCPFCGGTAVVDTTKGPGGMSYARCVSCAAEGPWGKSAASARGNWNRRTTPTFTPTPITPSAVAEAVAGERARVVRVLDTEARYQAGLKSDYADCACEVLARLRGKLMFDEPADLGAVAEAEQRGADRATAQVVADLKGQRFKVRASRGYFDEAGGWDPEDDEARNFDRIIGEWIHRIEAGRHIPPATESEADADHVSDWGPALAMALADVLPIAVLGVDHLVARHRRESDAAKVSLARDVLERYRAATESEAGRG